MMRISAKFPIKNVFKSNGVWCFDIRDELDAHGAIITTTKTRGTRSLVLGSWFLDSVTYQKESGSPKVFPTMRYRNEKGELRTRC